MKIQKYEKRPVSEMIALLGGFRLTLGDQPVPIGSGSKSEILLTQLALARQQPLPRTVLLERLWPDYDVALAGQSLNSLVYQLNKLANRFVKRLNLVSHDNGYYHLNNTGEIGLDIDYFDKWGAKGIQLLRSGELEQGIDYCERALALYRGDLIGDTTVHTIIERERLRATFLDLLAELADCHVAQDPAKSLSYVHQLLKHDPCREDAHRLAMRCYVQLQTRSQALRQYQLCCQILAAEFEAKPEPATAALYDQIRLDPGSVM